MTVQASLPRKSPVSWRTVTIVTVLAVVAASLAVAWTGRAWLLPRAARWLNVGQAPRRCDYVLVLPGGEETRPFGYSCFSSNNVIVPTAIDIRTRICTGSFRASSVIQIFK